MSKAGNFSGMIRLGLVLACFATAACVMLAFVYSATEKIIARRQDADLENSLKDIFPGADTFREVSDIKSPDPSVSIENQYEVLSGGKRTGAALRLSRASYGGPIKVLVGVGVDGKIAGVKILEHSDTPGLGANAASPSYFVDSDRGVTFYGQFAGKPVTDPFEVKEDVAAITASTITSSAVSAAVKAAGLGAAAWFAATEAGAVSGAREGGTR
jgi:electron transport complex protein RnfG